MPRQDKGYSFSIVNPDRTLQVICDTAESGRRWEESIRLVITQPRGLSHRTRSSLSS